METTSLPKRIDGFHLELVGEDILLYNPADIKIISLNQTAMIIWRLCDGTIRVDEMIEALQDIYPDAVDDIADDVHSTLQQFEEVGCITIN